MTVPDEPLVYAYHLAWVLERAAELVGALDVGELHWQPLLTTANSAATIASHLLGATAAYALGMGAGSDVTRDREDEFTSHPDARPDLLATALRELAARIQIEVPALTDEDLGRVSLPARALWGTGEPEPRAAREALVEAIRHAGIHLGELRLVHDLARDAASR